MPRGGKRPGSGAKKKMKLPFAPKPQAVSVLSHLGTEYKGQKLPSKDDLWLQLLLAQDLRIRLDSLKYLTDREEGKPAQVNTHKNADGEPFKVIFESAVEKD
jgi:hypothetical protein